MHVMTNGKNDICTYNVRPFTHQLLAKYPVSSSSCDTGRRFKRWKVVQVSTNIILSICRDMHSLLGENSSRTIEPVVATMRMYVLILETIFMKPKNDIYARHLLATRRQQAGESLDEYLQALKTLSKDCNFKNIKATQYRDESIPDAFITGLLSNSIRQRLLENKTLDSKTMFDQARSLESVMKSSESYTGSQPNFNAVPDSP